MVTLLEIHKHVEDEKLIVSEIGITLSLCLFFFPSCQVFSITYKNIKQRPISSRRTRAEFYTAK